MSLTSFSLCYSFFSLASHSAGSVFLWNRNCGDTGTLLWTHVVLTINENSSRENLFADSEPKERAAFCLLNIQVETGWQRNMRFLCSSGPLYNYQQNCFCCAITKTKLKKWLKLMASEERKKNKKKNREKKTWQSESVKAITKVKKLQNWKFHPEADIVYCIYWASLTFILLPRDDLLNYFDCFRWKYSSHCGATIISLRGKIDSRWKIVFHCWALMGEEFTR